MSDDGTFSIRVVDEDGDGVEDAKVQYAVGAVCGVGEGYTDSEGWVTFDITTGALNGDVIRISTIWVNGVQVSGDDVYPEDGDTFSFTLL